MSSVRIFFVGGLTSYRALFNWLSPWILIPSFFVAPIFQILLFAYIGREAGLENDRFYVIGNAIQYSAIPCLFAMANTIADERYNQTLGFILGSPAKRLPLFVGRSLPVISNGILVSAFGLTVGSLLLHVHIPAGSIAPLALVVTVSAAACTGLGLANAALGLRVRETAVSSNIIFGVLLIFCGVNVPLAKLPSSMSFIAQGLPLTHGIEAARRLADGQAFGRVGGLIAVEALIGLGWGLLGYVSLRVMEFQSRRHATLERM
jgi:ABC-2 type transport system permease protein